MLGATIAVAGFGVPCE